MASTPKQAAGRRTLAAFYPLRRGAQQPQESQGDVGRPPVDAARVGSPQMLRAASRACRPQSPGHAGRMAAAIRRPVFGVERADLVEPVRRGQFLRTALAHKSLAISLS